MTVMLKDFIGLFISFSEEIRIFDENENLIFKGEKAKLLDILSKKQTFATRKIFMFYIINNTIYIIVK